MKSFIIINGIIIIIGAVVNVIGCRLVSFCRFGTESLSA